MEELKREGKTVKTYADVIAAMKEKYPELTGTKVDVTSELGDIVLSINSQKLYMTPEQAIDLTIQIRRVVVKVKPKALRRR